MFRQSNWKQQVSETLQHFEQSISDLKKAEIELRAQNRTLTSTIRNIGKKLVLGLPVSLESLDKGLNYDLIFAEEVDAWKASATGGRVIDLRPKREFLKGYIPEAYNIPQDQLTQVLERLNPQDPLLMVCENGIRSASASDLLASRGFHFVYVLKGGMSLYRGDLVKEADTVEEAEELILEERLPAERDRTHREAPFSAHLH